MLPAWMQRVRMWLDRARLDAEMDEEIRTHLRMATEEHIRRGMSRSDARRAALRSFGGVEQVRERHRDARGLPWVDHLARDLRLAVRSLLGERAFTLTALVTLTIGIGANAAIVSVVDAVLLQPLPYPESQRIVTVGIVRANGNRYSARFTTAAYRLFRDESRSFEELGTFTTSRMPLLGRGEPEQVVVNGMTNSAFAVLGAPPALGRLPTVHEDVPGAARVALLSHELWSGSFGSDPRIVGSTIELNDTTREVIGVMPPSYGFQNLGVDVWVPMRLDTGAASTTDSRYHFIGRLHTGATPESASVDVDRLIQRLPEIGHAPSLLTTVLAGEPSVMELEEDLVGDARPLLLAVLGAVSLVLVIALSNVATLCLIRAEERAQHRALRAALGASSGRLAQYALTEALVLVLLGGAAGLLLAFAGTRVLVDLAPTSIPRLDGAGLDRLVFVHTSAVCGLAALAFALLPAARIRASRWHRAELTGTGRGATAGPERTRLRGALVATQVAFAVVLLIGAGLMARSYTTLRSVDPGFDPADIVTFGLVLPSTRYSNDEAVSLYRNLVERLRALPGVEAAGVTTGLPVTPVQAAYRLNVDDFPDRHDVFVVRWVTPGYFETMGIPVAAGRTMLPEDADELRWFVTVSFAEQHGSTESAIGQRLGPGNVRGDVVGVVGDDRIRGLDVPIEAAVYAPLQPFAPLVRSAHVVVRVGDRRTDLAPLLRHEVRTLDPRLPLIDVTTMRDVISESYAVSRTHFALLLFLVSALVALFLAAVGIYGVITYSVSRRTPEIGVRIALGATWAHIVTRVWSVGMAPAAAGLAVGLAGAGVSTHAVSSLLFETSRFDPPTFLAGPVVLLLVAFVASSLPALRAVRIEPMQALRTD